MNIDNFRILKIDEFNFVYEEKRLVKKKDNTEVEEWRRGKGYYGSIEQCLDNIKKYIVGNYVNNLEKYEDVLEKIKELNNAIVNCKLRVGE